MIKLLLLAALAGIAIAGARMGESPRDMAVKRLGLLVVLAAGSLAVIFPDAVTRLGQMIGVGRGADLVLYVLVMVSALVWIGTYKRLSRLEDKITELARAHALLAADRDRPGDSEPGQTPR